jgi:aminoglycoside phosphotransferase (APT) family kinase protein
MAHGDLDATHSYHQDGRYTGIIDFGEIRGATRCYDLGHIALHNGEIIPAPLLPQMQAGHSEVSPLPPDVDRRIRFWRLLIGVRAWDRRVNRPRSPYQVHLLQAIRASLTAPTM